MENTHKSSLKSVGRKSNINDTFIIEEKQMIETKRLYIRLFREEDAEALYKIKTDPQVMEY